MRKSDEKDAETIEALFNKLSQVKGLAIYSFEMGNKIQIIDEVNAVVLRVPIPRLTPFACNYSRKEGISSE